MAFQLFVMVFGCSTPGWKKASQCKKLIQYARHRLKMMQARQESMICHSREVIVSLLKLGQLRQALCRVEQLFKDQNRQSAYKEIDNCCQCIIENFHCIVEYSCIRDLPSDVNTALSSLAFAASRCGELPEINKLRYLFKDRYGKEFESNNVNLQFGNLVSNQLKQALTTKPISQDSKVSVINEIAKEHAVAIGSPYQFSENAYISRIVLSVNDFVRKFYSNIDAYVLIFHADATPDERDIEFGQDEKFFDFAVQATSKNGADDRSDDNGAFSPFTLVHPLTRASTTKKWPIIMKFYHELLSARTSMESTDEEIRVNEIVYLDDIKTKTPTQLSPHSTNMIEGRGNNAVSCACASCDSHLRFVHPRLPDYDELVSKFKGIKTGQVQGRRSLWY